MSEAGYVVQLRHERDLLAQALGDLLVAIGAVEAASLTRPQLLLAAEDATVYYAGLAESVVPGGNNGGRPSTTEAPPGRRIRLLNTPVDPG